jgi:hypothetical protein
MVREDFASRLTDNKALMIIENNRQNMNSFVDKVSKEVVSAYLHTRVLALYVESILRYGQDATKRVVCASIQPRPGQTKRVVEALDKLYAQLHRTEFSSVSKVRLVRNLGGENDFTAYPKELIQL